MQGVGFLITAVILTMTLSLAAKVTHPPAKVGKAQAATLVRG